MNDGSKAMMKKVEEKFLSMKKSDLKRRLNQAMLTGTGKALSKTELSKWKKSISQKTEE